jgi:hypothetical protein
MMETKQIISWLYDKAARAMDHSYARMLNMTAKRLRELDEKQRWIPVTERLPEPGQEVIVFSGGVVEGTVFAYHFWNKDFQSWQHITHWMPLPEPPKEVE